MTETPRELAYKTIVQPLTIQEVAREAGLTEDFVLREVKEGRLHATITGQISGKELARFFAAHRRS